MSSDKLKIENSLTALLAIGFFMLVIFATPATLLANTGSLDSSAQNTAKVCKDVSCINPPPGIIAFKIGKSPLIVDSNTGVKGTIWGNELGDIVFNPNKGGVHFKDPQTGLLSGTASYNDGSISGLINFSVTGQKVVIDPKTGEWKGWAFASGPKGGWIKFDCQDPASCVRTTWRGEEKAKINLSAAVINATPASTIRISDLTSAYQSYLSPVAVPPVTFLPTIILPSIPTPSPTLPLGKGEMPKAEGVNSDSTSVSTSSLQAALTKLLNKKEIADKLRGPQGATGPQGPAGIAAPIGSSAMSVSQPARSITPSAPTANPVVFLPVGITMPNPSMNFSGGAYASIANLTSNLFTNTTSNITTLNVAGSTVLSGSLNVTGVATIPTLTTTTGAIDVLTVGGGYGSTGLTVSNTGNIQANGTLTIDGTSTLTGATTITGTVTNSALTASRLVFTDASKVLTSTGDSAAVSNAVSDETGTGVLVLGTSPTFITSITSPLVIGGTATTSDLTLQTTSGVGTTGADMHFLTGSNGATEAMTILNSGNVGIGTTAPGAKLDVSGLTRIYDQTAVTGVSTLTIRAGAGQATGPSHLFDIFANDGTTARFHVTDTGNVGIGTTGPANKLQVVHTSAGAETVPLLLQNNDATDGTAVSLGFSPYTGTITSKIMSSHDGTANYSLRFYNWDADTLLTERMRISNTGNVGIGTTEPTSSLQVSKSQATNTTIAVDNLDVANDGVIAQSLVSASASNIYTRAYGPANTTSRWGLTVGSYSELANTIGNGIIIGTRVVSPIIFGINSAEKMRIDTAGNVGIGTTAPATVLHMVDSGGDALRGFLIDSANAGNAGPIVIGRKARGSISSPTAVTADDALLVLSGWGYGATGYSSGGRANIRLVATETWTDTAQGTYASFYTTPTGTATAAEVMRINGAGNVGIGITNPSTLLHLKGTASLARVMFQESGGNQTAQIGMSAASTGRLGIFGDVGGELVSVCTSAVSCTAIGNLGLGTTNPTSLLELGTNEGDLTFSGTGNHDITASAGTLRLGAVTATGAITAASSPLNIGSSGVRFGTIYADSVDATNLVGGVVTGSTTSADWTINSDNATADTEDMTVTFERGTASPNAVLKWTSASDQFDFNFGGSFSGNVGIGTTAPGLTLDVKGAAYINQAARGTIRSIDSTAMAAGVGGGIVFNGIYTGTSIVDFAGIKGVKENATDNNYASALSFSTRANGADLIENMVLSSSGTLTIPNGNLGIGTTNPSAKLHVGIRAGDTSDITIGGASTDRAILTYIAGTTDTFTIGTIQDSVNYFDTLAIKSGNVGIGTTGPSAILTVSSATVPKINLDVTAGGERSYLSYTEATSLARLDSDGSIVFAANNSEVMRITSNVGIGTTAPTANLQVAQGTAGVGTVSNLAGGTTVTGVGTQFLNTFKVGDTITINAETVAISAIASDTSMTTAAITGANSGVAYTLTGGTRFSVLGNGNVGIGTTEPGQKLQVVGGTFGVFNSATTGGFSVDGNAQAGMTSIYSDYLGGSEPKLHISNYGQRGSTGGITIDTSGNVGIGTTGPGYLLHTSSATANTYSDTSASLTLPAGVQHYAEVTSGSNLNFAGIGFSPNNSSGIYQQSYIGTYSLAGASQYSGVMVFGSRTGATSYSERMRIDSTGNVGIGTTEPATKLHISGAVGATSIIKMSVSDGTAWEFGERATPGDFTFRELDGNKDVLTMQSDGNVGIGTTAPGTKLQVGDATAQTTVSIFGKATTADVAPVLALVRQNSWYMGMPNTSDLSLSYNMASYADASILAGSKFYITSTGNVGIGTTEPLGKLGVIDISTSRTADFSSSGARTANNYGIVVSNATTNATTDGTRKVGVYIDSTGISTGGAGAATTNYGLYIDTVSGADNNYGAYISGNVGIGTTAPNTLLEISGAAGVNDFSIRRSDNAAASGGIMFRGSDNAADGFIGYNRFDNGATRGLEFGSVGGDGIEDIEMVIEAGNVGIGTTNPGYPLEVKGTAGAISILTAGADATAGVTSVNSPYMGLRGKYWTGATSAGLDMYLNTVIDASGNYRLGVSNNSGAEKFSILSTGNVGIGTTAPLAKLSVNGDAMFGNVAGLGTGTQTVGIQAASNIPSLIVAGYGTAGQSKGIQILAGTNSSDYALDVKSYASANLLYVRGDGNVGLGTTVPGTKLEVYGNEPVLRIKDDNPYHIDFRQTSGGDFDITNNLAETVMLFQQDADVIMGTTGGNVGIGMTNPSVALDVTGDIEYTGTITDVSDVRLKENITDFNGALGIVSSLQAKTYNMIGDPESEVGFIAQDVQALFPGATSTIDPTNGYLGVSYVSLIPIISQAVKEMNLNLEGIAGTTTPLPGSASESFATAFFTNLKTTLSAWLADAGNGITDIFANKATLDQVCLKDTNGTSCYTRTQLDTLLAGAGGSIVNNTGSGTTTTSTTPAATCSDGIQNQDETGIDTGGVCATPDSSTPDTTAPVITLTGEITINLNVGDTYTEQGANATDNVDASVAVIISGSVDTATAGTYTIHYNASDTAGNPATEITRTVNVAAAL